MKFILWGTGQIFNKYKSYINFSNVVALVDNDCEKWGTKIEGLNVVAPVDLDKYEYNYIVIMAVKYESIRKQLLNMNIAEDKIVDREHRGIFKDIILQKKFEVTRPFSEKKRRIALISHTLDRTGAPLVLLNLAKVLIEAGFYVDVYSFGTDKIVDEFLKLNIPVTMFLNMHFDVNYCYEQFEKYDLVLVNTLVLYKVVELLRNICRPVIWWLHEEDDYMHRLVNEGMNIRTFENLHIFGVSERVISALKKYYPEIKCDLLPYGIVHENVIEKKENKKIVFAVIGSVCTRKGQDVLLEAVINKSNEWKEKAEFWIIGSISNEKREEYQKCELIKVIGECNHSEVIDLYRYIDVVVCPSLNDPLPVVIAEAMQQKRICIVSDMTGMSKFISQYKDGLICKAGDSCDLQTCIQWVLDNIDKATEMGEMSYKIYVNNFSMTAFRNNVIGIVNEVL